MTDSICDTSSSTQEVVNLCLQIYFINYFFPSSNGPSCIFYQLNFYTFFALVVRIRPGVKKWRVCISVYVSVLVLYSPVPCSDPQTMRKHFQLKGEAPAFHNRDQFLEYFQDNWMEGNYPLRMWNMYSLDGPRTNNNTEGWHSKIRKAHPNRLLSSSNWMTFFLWACLSGSTQHSTCV